mmetsp:Transcript_75721/g.136571  ORF Transcript_75721/g.136571 Transcript_75721/m.136571 type:complete len:221 (+) Transcript_75721:96-758(+)
MSRGSVRPYPLDPLEDEFARTPLNTRGNSARDLPGSWLTFAEEGKGAPSDMHAVPRTDDFPNPPQSVHDLAPKWRLVGHGFSAVCILFGIICFCNAFACFSGEARDDIQAERAAKGFCCWRDHPTPVYRGDPCNCPEEHRGYHDCKDCSDASGSKWDRGSSFPVGNTEGFCRSHSDISGWCPPAAAKPAAPNPAPPPPPPPPPPPSPTTTAAPATTIAFT